MQALVLRDYMHLSCDAVPDPRPAPDEVVVRVKACGICGSDVHGMDGSTGRRIPPVIMGHEAAGVVQEAGAEAAACWRPGDRVTFDSTVYCGRCGFCRRGAVNLCDGRRVLGVSCAEYRRDGALAECVAVPERVLYRLPDEVSFVDAALTEPLSVALHAVRRGAVDLATTAVVVGAGVIGLMIVQLLARMGCGRIVVLDIDAARLALAGSLGAGVTVDAGATDAGERLRDAVGEGGAEIAFEAVGLPATVTRAVTCVRKGGQVVLVGNVSPETPLALQTVVTRELTLLGSCASSGEYPDCLALMARGAVTLAPLVSAVAPLAEGQEWFMRLHARERGLVKVVLVP